MDKLKENLMALARDNGICSEGYEHMRVSDFDRLVEYYIQNPDWCMERGYPSLQTLRELAHRVSGRGIFVERTFHGQRLDGRLVYIFHNCRGQITTGLNVKDALIPMLYLANGTELHINVAENVKVPVYVFGGCKVTTDTPGRLRIYKEELL